MDNNQKFFPHHVFHSKILASMGFLEIKIKWSNLLLFLFSRLKWKNIVINVATGSFAVSNHPPKRASWYAMNRYQFNKCDKQFQNIIFISKNHLISETVCSLNRLSFVFSQYTKFYDYTDKLQSITNVTLKMYKNVS